MTLINPVQRATDAFLVIWDNLPLPIRSLFYLTLFLVVIYALYRLLSR